MLDRLLYQDFRRRVGGDLDEKQKQRLLRTVRHYMNEVSVALPNQSLPVLNKEVLSAVVPDYLAYLRRSAGAPPAAAAAAATANGLAMDVSSRFEQLQNERNTSSAKNLPNPPDFRISLEEAGPSAMSIFENVRKQREDETRRSEAALANRMQAESSFGQAAANSEQVEAATLAKREQARRAAMLESQQEFASRLVTPDPRRIFMKEIIESGSASASASASQGTPIEALTRFIGTGNPTIALPEAFRTRPALPQDNIIPNPDILSYKENEYNLFVYSADRDWVRLKDENRYNFSVIFDPANNRPGFGLSPAAHIKFKNITRIELVKTILPVEGIDTLVKKTGANAFDTGININILSFPYLNVYIKELDTNSYGTDYRLEQAFGVIQYDANWTTDTNISSKGGFLAMIPKFLKCQKVYTPTPLATLQKLTIQIQRPDGELVSDLPDTLDITQILSSYNLGNCGSPSGNTSGTFYADTSGNYLWLKTSQWFSRFMVNQGDRIALGGLAFPSSYSGDQAALQDLFEFLQRPEGHLVVGVAYGKDASGGTIEFFTDGSNIVGYSEYIIIQSKFLNPATGATGIAPFGNLSPVNNLLFLADLCSNTLTAGRLINLSHQTHLVFRVITRDMDATSRLRADNM